MEKACRRTVSAVLTLICLFSIMFFSCDGGFFGSSDDEIIFKTYDANSWRDTGNLYANRGRSVFRAPDDPSTENYTYKITLSRGNRSFSKSFGGGTVVVMENIPVGSWMITCRAYRLDGSIEYMGSVDVEIVADETTAATVELRKCPVVKFMDDDGNVIASQTVEFGATVTKPSRPTKDGFVFTGWNKADGSKFDFNTAINENLTLSPNWMQTPENFAYVEGGTFQMGGPDNGPVHSVTVSSFLMCDHEVTWDEYTPWLDTIDDNLFPTYGDKPAHQVRWYYAVEYCNWKSQQEGLTPCYTIDKDTPDPNNMFTDDRYKWTVTCDFTADGYRLPTEAEWEYAARGGNQSHGYLYSGSDNVAAVAVCTENNTSSVMSKTPNELGLYDMSGNLYEWCWDWKGDYPSSPQTNPTGPVSGTYRICRGGCYGCNDTYGNELSDCRVFARSTYVQCFNEARYGFRVVRSIGD